MDDYHYHTKECLANYTKEWDGVQYNPPYTPPIKCICRKEPMSKVERPRKIEHDNGGNALFLRYKLGWNTCQEQYDAWLEAEILKPLTKELILSQEETEWVEACAILETAIQSVLKKAREE